LKAVALSLIRGYQVLVSPLLGQRCKYYPSCSQYAAEAVRELGVVHGCTLACWRLLRCNPWSHGGVDHVRDRTLFREQTG
jgi:putative membrane protein insertion efficiency factor